MSYEEQDDSMVPIEMVDWHCASCGVFMSMPQEFQKFLRTSHNPFYCLNGHPNRYVKKTPIEEIEGKLMNEYAKAAQLEARIKELENRGLVDRIINKK